MLYLLNKLLCYWNLISTQWNEMGIFFDEVKFRSSSGRMKENVYEVTKCTIICDIYGCICTLVCVWKLRTYVDMNIQPYTVSITLEIFWGLGRVMCMVCIMWNEMYCLFIRFNFSMIRCHVSIVLCWCNMQ